VQTFLAARAHPARAPPRPARGRRLTVLALDSSGRRATCATRIEKADGSVATEGEAVVLLPAPPRPAQEQQP
jgi:hypothetical protein